MAYTTARVKGNYADILYGDGGSPTEVFTQLCGISTRGLEVTYKTAFEAEDYDCADPEAVAQTLKEVGAQDWSISGNGLYNRTQMAALRGLLGASHNFRFAMDEPSGDSIDDGWWQGSGFISSYKIDGNDGDWTKVSLTITGTALLSWADAA